MADRLTKGPKKEGTLSSSSSSSIELLSVKRSSSSSSSSSSTTADIQDKNKSRSPIITRSRSRNRDNDIVSRIELNNNNSSGAINRSSKRLKSCSETSATNDNNNNNTENKNKKAKVDNSNSKSQQRQEQKSQKRTKTNKHKSLDKNKNKKTTTTTTTATATNIDSQLIASSSTSSVPSSQQQQQPQASTSKSSNNNNKSKSSKKIEYIFESKEKGNNNKKRKTDCKTITTTVVDSKTNSSSSSTSSTLSPNKKKKKTNEKKESKRKQTIPNRFVVMDQNGSNFSNNVSNNQNTNNNNNNNNATSNSNESSSTSSSNNSTAINPSTSALLSSYGLAATDPDTDETDMNRLQSILESRGLHQHLLGIPRMQNLFYRSFSTSSNTKAQQLLNSYNSATNDSEKLHYVLEMCQLLLMGNEDTLVGFPIKSVVPTLINLLSMEHNFEIMNHACRALTYMMEALPRSSVVVLDAVPVFLEKLQVIQCMDVAEQSLSALEMLSRRHNKAILHARGVSACLTFLDFFSIDAQRSALTITANCFQNLSIDDFQYVQDSLQILGSHLTIEDKKCIESICLAFYRLVECYQNDCVIISEIASQELLTNIQNVLMNMPPILSTGSFVNVIRMLSIMCVSCSQIAVELLKLNICETLKCLLLCNENLDDKNEMNLITRSPQEICELTSFIAELMPSLPLTGIFSVDLLFSKANTQSSDVFQWQWKNDRGIWESFNPFDNKIIEQAHLSGEDELELAHVNRTFILDFNSMQKICEDTGNAYPIQRKTNTFNNTELLTRANMQTSDPRSEFFYKEHTLIKDFIKFVFKVLNEVYNNSAGYSVRYKCLNGILRIIYYSPKELLKSILVNQSISSSIATMLASHDIRVVVCAVQMCNILMEKMPEIFSIYFQREGVIHQIRQLYTDESRFNDKSSTKDVLNNKQISSSSNNNNNNNGAVQLQNPSAVLMEHLPMMFSRSSDAISSIVLPPHFNSVPVVRTINSGQTNNSNANNNNKSNGASTTTTTTATDQTAGRHDENVKRKRTRKMPFPNTRQPFTLENFPESTTAAAAAAENDLNICSSLSTTYLNNLPLLVSETINGPNLANITSHHKGSSNNRLGSSKDFLQRFNPTRWARWTQSAVNPNTNVIPTTSNVPATAVVTTGGKETTSQKSINTNRDSIKTWIKEQGKTFDDKYFVKNNRNNQEKDGINSSPILNDLSDAISLLKQDSQKGLTSIKKLLLDSDLSSFELIHSGLVKNLLSFLISNENENILDKRENHLRLFLNVFIGSPQNEMAENINEINIEKQSFLKLVNKLNACLSQLEQFPLRIQDYSSISARGSHPLKFISSNFLKVILNRHPSCTNLKNFKGPMIKLDPFTTVQSIERYLLSRGYGKIKETEEDSDDDDELSDEDSLDLNLSSSSPTMGKHRLQLLIDEHVLPYDMPLFQVIKQYMLAEMENDSEENHHLGSSKFWSSTFYIFYRLGTESNTTNTAANNNTVSSSTSSTSTATTTSTVSSSGKTSNTAGNGSGSRRNNKNKSTKKKDELWLDGKVSKSISPLESYLKKDLLFNTNINEQTCEVISLLRVLYGINKYWGHLYKFSLIYQPLIPLKEFINNKLTVKANRQLQDPVIIMTSTLPNWLQEIAYACPFIFPFETRYLLFYAVCFDRDRALQRLFENTPDLTSSENRERLLTPRIEKRKKIISRNDIFKSAENLFNDVSNSRSLLEIQYENEVGTGLGPTLEFYALVSKEFQRAEFEMWRGEVVVNNIKNEKLENSINYVYSNYGLFPVPIGRNTKPSQFTKIKHRFKLLGKFMAKALMDSRMIDINLNVLFYKWLLNEESTLSVMDLYHLDYTFFSSISQMYKIALKKIKMNGNNNPDLLKLHGSSIEDLNLDFIMPGYPNIELRKGGKDIPVTLNNLENYIELVSHWSVMEGIIKQMEAFKEGFNSIFTLSQLKLFYPEELQQLFCGSNNKNWDYKMLMDSCKTDHGFTHESRAIKFLFQILSSYNNEEQRKFLQFLTGFPRLPIGGFKSLNPPFTIVKKSTTESENPNCLPSVMTCANYLKLPDYPTIEIMKEKLKIAINEGQFSFHLS